MAADQAVEDRVELECVCGGAVRLEPELLGRVVPCRHCGRYLRPALQFMLADQEYAPNLAAQCTCGHFVVAPPDAGGKRVRCKVCRTHVIMPRPVVKFDVEPFVRVPRKVLQGSLRREEGARERASEEMGRLTTAAHAGRITLGPGQRICVNPDCGALLPMRAAVCPQCGTNRITGERYEGPGPEADPSSKWRPV
jgi:hypothetical protein